jgi:peptidylprolyl isomerase
MNAPALLIASVAWALAASVSAAPRFKPPATAPAAPSAPGELDWRTPDPQNVLVIDTNKGRIIVEMTPAAVPQHVARIRELTRSGAYNGRSFFRVIDNFMDQTGDPLDNGTGGSALPNLPPEFIFRRGSDTPLVVVTKADGLESGFIGALPVISQTMDLGMLTADHRVNAWGTFCPGVAGMARSDAPDSANSQFFLTRATTTSLDEKYTAWGRVISGYDVIRAIKTGEPVSEPQDKMLNVHILADLPAAQRPTVRVIDPAGPWFKATVERTRAERADNFSICDLDLPSDIK